MIIGVISSKGGTGKSTIALNLASILSTRKSKVLLIDADPQGSIGTWSKSSKQDDPTILIESRPVIHMNIDKVKGEYDFIVIDTPPSYHEQTISALKAVDKIIIPVTAGITDIWGIQRILELYDKEKISRPELSAKLLISRLDKRTTLGRDFRSYLDKMGYPVFKTEIYQRVIYGKSWLSGLTVDKLEPKGEAANNMNQLAKEIRTW